MRRFHVWLGIVSAGFLILSAATGILWAYAPHLYWKPGYLQRKHPAVLPSFDEDLLPLREALRVAREQWGSESRISKITLHGELGMMVYEILGKRRDGETSLLVDARTGKTLSPITPLLAEQIARAYAEGAPSLRSIVLLDRYVHRSGKVYPSVYKVCFDGKRDPEFFVDAHSGKLLEEQDRLRRFHWWVMRLHQLNFFGFRKTLTVLPGATLLLLVFSGLVLAALAARRASKANPDRDRKTFYETPLFKKSHDSFIP
ncbi:MAG: PepSY domain-containing protein [Verrucomicrobiae bacterium]|nr:PepSY domain-containing protein [Verrucomicrobiae bacterium]